jgi:intracellular sulfur oxidation DsrE/DsrF family protein
MKRGMMHSLISRNFLVVMLGLVMTGIAQADDACPVGVLPGSPGTPETTLNDEFGPGTSDKTNCLSKREGIKVVMQLNKSCRDSYATHATGKNGKPTGEISKVVNNVANCDGNRPYALGNLKNMLKDLKTTNGIAPEDIDIRVVVHSGGGYLLLNDAGFDGDGNYIASGRNKFQGDVESLMAEGVRFLFCQNTTRGFIKNKTLPGQDLIDSTGGATAQLIPGVEYVTAGVTAISDLQQQGFKYIQP